MAILSKLVLLGIGNTCFYLGIMGYLEPGVHIAIYGALYLVIGLILTIGRRVIPFFVERGVGYQVTLFNSRWIDISSLVFFLAFFVSELFLHAPWLSQLTASAMFLITTVRIIGWYTPGIFKTPLLWSLFAALGFIDLGFLLFALQGSTSISPYLPVHAFGIGGIGIMTMGMMARVSVGHTGRNLQAPPGAGLDPGRGTRQRIAGPRRAPIAGDRAQFVGIEHESGPGRRLPFSPAVQIPHQQ